MRFRTALFTTALLAGATVTAAAVAGNRIHDRVYADSFGNLVIQSPYGYKRIIIGEGNLAGELRNHAGGSEPEVVYADPEPLYRGYYIDNCYRPPVLLKGRSYMYGLPDGVIPEPSGRCPSR